MRERRGTGRRLALTAAVLVAVGASFVHSDAASASSHSHAASASSRSDAASASSHSHAASESSHSDAASASAHSNAASASSRDRSFAVIKFWPSRNVVTLDIPSACPDSHPTCVWVLTVNEPETPAQTLVGTATGTSGVLTVAYPDDFCGVIQADATVGPAPWKIQFGHRAAIHTGSCNPVAARSALPFTASSPIPTLADAMAKTEPAQLPFTGISLKPLTIVGLSLVLLGFNILTTVEERRRGMQRARSTVRSNPAGVFASRVSRWFMGE
jgi:hypothetical protein